MSQYQPEAHRTDLAHVTDGLLNEDAALIVVRGATAYVAEAVAREGQHCRLAALPAVVGAAVLYGAACGPPGPTRGFLSANCDFAIYS